MALSKESFDIGCFDLVKQKYYNANKVNARMAELAEEAEALLVENEELRAAYADVSAARAEIGDTMLTAKRLAAATIKEAQDEAARILQEARMEAQRITDKAQERVYLQQAPLTDKQLAEIESLNAQLDDLNVSHATQIYRLKQKVLNIAAGNG